uniref:Uncharacterized protein n=1 Tax=Lactuca sativa TaxID=4236 RepID=A0A9R1WH30_LACSA|nr:hypothetical protein LSAT_V11C100035430 [Lactuca sativa]
MFLIINNAGQGVLSSSYFKYADTILKKYSSIVATILTGFTSAALFGHTLTINSMLGISIIFISMHQVNVFSPLSKVKEEENRVLELEPIKSNNRLSLCGFLCKTTTSYLSQQLAFEMKEDNLNKNELVFTYTVHEV